MSVVRFFWGIVIFAVGVGAAVVLYKQSTQAGGIAGFGFMDFLSGALGMVGMAFQLIGVIIGFLIEQIRA